MLNSTTSDLCKRFARNELSARDRERLVRLSKQQPDLRRELLLTVALHRALATPLEEAGGKKEPLRTREGA